jgi:hypothetical protein
VTASYVTSEMRGLHEAAKERGVVLLNEVGLDPGIDHMVSERGGWKRASEGEREGGRERGRKGEERWMMKGKARRRMQ